MNKEFDGKVAVITGASRGIGRGIALELARCGATIIGAYQKEEKKANILRKEIEKLGQEALMVKCDVSDSGDVAKLYASVMKKFSRVDFIINNAGIHQHLKSWELSEEDWRKVIDVNLTGTFLVTKAFTPYMIEKKAGRVVNISSCVAFTGTDHEVHYAASKGAVLALTKSLALELASHGINVNAIAPGYIDTDMAVFDTPAQKAEVLKGIPKHRLGLPADIGKAARFLCSADSEYITGQVIHVNGGMIMY
jgi:3-oxoacyl-[acyl-carrier protein] reductase